MNIFSLLSYSTKDKVATLTLNRPEARNSLNQQLRLELLAAITKASDDESVRVIIIAANGKGFCAGADLNEQLDGFGSPHFTERQLCQEYNPIIEAITNAPKPVLAAINGAAAGFGAALALACDLIIMDDNAFLYSAFGSISLIPDGGSHKFLLQSLGPKKAYEMIAFSQRLSAQQCLQAGIVNHVCPEDQLLDEAKAWADKLSDQAPLTLRYSKELLREVGDKPLAFCLEKEASLQDPLVRSNDFKEGLNAFSEKRKPNFQGR